MKTLEQLKAELYAEEMRLQDIKRGQIVMLDLPTVSGSVQNGLRPCVIISNNKANKFSPNVIAVPLTSRNKKDMPTHYLLEPSKRNGLRVASTVLAEQILTVSKNLKNERSPEILLLIEYGLYSFLTNVFLNITAFDQSAFLMISSSVKNPCSFINS